MNCPDCLHENLDGTDTCEQCGQDLRSLDIPTPSEGLQRALMETPLKNLGLQAPKILGPGDSLLKALQVLDETPGGSVLVVEDGRLVGIFTERDVLNRLAGKSIDLKEVPVSDLMTPRPETLTEDDVLAHALHQMAVRHYRHIPVLRKGYPVGFVSLRGLLEYLASQAL